MHLELGKAAARQPACSLWGKAIQLSIQSHREAKHDGK